MSFDTLHPMIGTFSGKWDSMGNFGVGPDGIAMHVADSDYPTAPCVIEAVTKEAQRGIFNYGFDRIRFPAPVHAGARIRETRTLRRVEIKGDMLETMMEVVIEAEGSAKPVCVAERIGRIVF